MDKSIKLIQNSKFKIQHLITPILFFLLLSCSSPTETPKGSLSGTVNLEGMEDHSNIIVAIYELAELDETIVGINSQYPHIGVIINQHTEFDHRLQEPVKYTETDTEGHFEIKKIPTGTYNIIALKDSFGFKYIYEFEIEKGDNALSELTPRSPLFNPIEGKLKNSERGVPLEKNGASVRQRRKLKGVNLDSREADITLYPETHISGNVSGSVTVETNHHLVIDDDTVFMPNTSTLIIQPGAVIRINPGKDLTIHGTLTAQGEENNMFWVTTNAGFSESLMPNVPDSLAYYNSFELTSYASVSGDLIEWGKWDYGNISFSTAVSNLDINHLICRHSESGLTISDTDDVNASNIISTNCLNESDGGIVLLDCNNLNLEQSILINNYNGLYFKFCDNSLIKNNYISTNTKGIWGLTVFGDIEHNELTKNTECDIKLAGNTTQGEIRIKYNNLQSDTGIWQYEQGSFNSFYTMLINYNNFYCGEWFIKYDSSGISNDINATENFFNYLNEENEILEMILDTSDEYNISVIVNYWHDIPLSNTGIE